jgi:heme-degrading monooxygenase HmoA
MFTIVWAYKVLPEKQTEFEKLYSSNGDWAELFKKSRGYLGTKLIRSDILFENYATIDTWETKEDYETFLTQWKDEYEKLDGQCQELTESESHLGSFEKIIA